MTVVTFHSAADPQESAKKSAQAAGEPYAGGENAEAAGKKRGSGENAAGAGRDRRVKAAR